MLYLRSNWSFYIYLCFGDFGKEFWRFWTFWKPYKVVSFWCLRPQFSAKMQEISVNPQLKGFFTTYKTFGFIGLRSRTKNHPYFMILKVESQKWQYGLAMRKSVIGNGNLGCFKHFSSKKKFSVTLTLKCHLPILCHYFTFHWVPTLT